MRDLRKGIPHFGFQALFHLLCLRDEIWREALRRKPFALRARRRLDVFACPQKTRHMSDLACGTILFVPNMLAGLLLKVHTSNGRYLLTKFPGKLGVFARIAVSHYDVQSSSHLHNRCELRQHILLSGFGFQKAAIAGVDIGDVWVVRLAESVAKQVLSSVAKRAFELKTLLVSMYSLLFKCCVPSSSYHFGFFDVPAALTLD